VERVPEGGGRKREGSVNPCPVLEQEGKPTDIDVKESPLTYRHEGSLTDIDVKESQLTYRRQAQQTGTLQARSERELENALEQWRRPGQKE